MNIYKSLFLSVTWIVHVCDSDLNCCEIVSDVKLSISIMCKLFWSVFLHCFWHIFLFCRNSLTTIIKVYCLYISVISIISSWECFKFDQDYCVGWILKMDHSFWGKNQKNHIHLKCLTLYVSRRSACQVYYWHQALYFGILVSQLSIAFLCLNLKIISDL